MQEATTGCQEVPEAKMEAQAAGGGHRVQSRAARLPSGCGRDGPESRANPKSARPAPRATRPPARNLFLTEGEPAPPLGGHVAAPCSALGAVARCSASRVTVLARAPGGGPRDCWATACPQLTLGSPARHPGGAVQGLPSSWRLTLCPSPKVAQGKRWRKRSRGLAAPVSIAARDVGVP